MRRRPVILLDCRWLGPSGAGRATELLLRGLRELEPPGSWILWGPAAVDRYAWPGTLVERSTRDPRALLAQRDLASVPPHDVGVFMLQVRPLTRAPSVTLIHDTTQVHHGANPIVRRAKLAFLRRVGSVSTRVLTVSTFSKHCIERDLRVPSSKIEVIGYPIDEDLVKRVHELRETATPRRAVLFVGQFAPHKNLDRLVHAFARTRFARHGGELLLVGGAAPERRRLERVASDLDATIHVRGPVSQEQLDELYATCRALVLPSLTEGFGLPAWEAAACGMPVCVSDRGALREIVPDPRLRFDPTSLQDIATHIDAAVDGSMLGPFDEPTLPHAGSGSLTSFAASFVAAVQDVLDRS